MAGLTLKGLLGGGSPKTGAYSGGLHQEEAALQSARKMSIFDGVQSNYRLPGKPSSSEWTEEDQAAYRLAHIQGAAKTMGGVGRFGRDLLASVPGGALGLATGLAGTARGSRLGGLQGALSGFQEGFNAIPGNQLAMEHLEGAGADLRARGVNPYAVAGMEVFTPGPGELAAVSGAAARGGRRVAMPHAIYNQQPTAGQANAVTQAPNLRNLDNAEALTVARTGRHLKLGDEGFIGGPEGVATADQLLEMRRHYDSLIEDGAILGADWYTRQRAAFRAIGGEDPTTEVDVSSIFSAQASPQNQTTFHIRDRNAYMHGMSGEVRGKTEAQAKKSWLVREGGLSLDTPKTGIYGQAGDPSRPLPSVGVNDIHQGRAFGYKKAEGAFTAAQHRFLDYEGVLAAERANAQALGGRTDWTPTSVQAAAWVAQKGKTDFARGLFPTLAASKENAAKTVGDYFEKQSMHTPYEGAPLSGIGHEADPGDLNWTNPDTGKDIIHEEIGFGATPDQATTGVWVDPDTKAVELNPSVSPSPLVDIRNKGGRHISPEDLSAIRGGESVRGLVDVQAISGYGSVFPAGAPGVKLGDVNAAHITGTGPLSQQQTGALASVTEAHGFGGDAGFTAPWGTRSGVGVKTWSDFGYSQSKGWNSPDPDKWPKKLGKKKRDKRIAQQQAHRSKTIRKNLPAFQKALTDAGIPGEVQAGVWQGGHVDRTELIKEVGTGNATRAMLDDIANMTEATRKRLTTSREIREQVGERLRRDADQAELDGVNVREDFQKLREIIHNDPNWYETLILAVQDGEYLPAIVLPLVGLGVVAAAQPEPSGPPPL